jgi:hypothetical protein
VNDDELDRLRIALLHAYDPTKTLPQRLAKAVKDRMTGAPKPNHKTVVREKKDKDAA